MTRRRKILLVALLCISPVICLVGREAYKAYLSALNKLARAAFKRRQREDAATTDAEAVAQS